MNVRIVGNRIVWYEFLSDELQNTIIHEIVSSYPPSKLKRDAYNVDDDSPIGQLLRAIDCLVDLHGAAAIDWINEHDLKSLSNNINNVINMPLHQPERRVKLKHPLSFYEDALIRLSDVNLIRLQSDPKVEILFVSPSYAAARDFAKKYLHEHNANKRIYISRDRNLNIVWVKKA